VRRGGDEAAEQQRFENFRFFGAPHVAKGVEMVFGIKNDPQFERLIAIGFGEIMIELLRDTAVRLAPEHTARAMLESLKGRVLLSGVCERARVHFDGLVDAICRLWAHGRKDGVDQIDVNPLIVATNSVMAVDALVIVRS
jgi:acetate---CoA ligase (ADP-forming)